MSEQITTTLSERESQYGSFQDNAFVIQSLKRIIRESSGYSALHDDQRESLDMIASKIGRILGGNPDYVDNWHDIVGYASLIERRIINEQES